MPRRSSGRSSAPTRAAPAPAAPARQPPPAAAPAAAPPAAAPAAGGGMMSGLAGSMMSGMAAGVGMSVANRAVDAVMGPRQTEVVHRHEGGEAPAAAPAAAASAAPAADKCTFEREQFQQCMSTNDFNNCKSFADMLKQCQAA
mmetsp:Transcript_62513/g.167436  ORF Transcript_62513/g.167436 Transcript_62513/m.167436 type:complete len:143 (-) Transcript_62513:252-680(-)